MTLPLIILIIGAVVYLACSLAGKYSEVGELGRIAFFAGLLAFLLK